MSASITIHWTPAVRYLLRLADTCLISGQRLGEWCGHAPILEEDIALTNMALDLIGQSRALLTLAGQVEGRGHARTYDEDQLAFLRDERDYLNPTLVELPNGAGKPGDFALTVVRNVMVSTYLKLWWERLADSSEPELAAIAGKAVKEARYHQQHAGDWLVRLGDGTDESRRRVEAALGKLWPYHAELFDADEVDAAAQASGLGPSVAALKEPWLAEMRALLDDATLAMPPEGRFVSTGRRGVHSEHLGYILAEMQYLQRAYPGGAW
ncbi:phenylacetate-CoA oxygenase subunit PaaC [Calidifontimicrobium sp. SYSU G02091]|uniref:1,2-phenylacetyl-CoA epoxidase subunit PaaC n=1 Tax=Calidifontimicrobium sp. SYSU G02091 TaxID=2926421 RepID=UPI001F539C3B|nr:1,2-phenylacetyl-CoA epoxidase subunit PaaC [Calidifontimicrobium sp. SYSU G02091]MCI1193208.1 phenylacetate-CoA oxygenase subunit PaaC [Calidifontimicrobium sp. SYSU G02091]